MIITDGRHLVSTISEDELHTFAECLGFKKSWYQKDNKHPHYDLTTKATRQRAINAGAKLTSSKALVELAWWNEK